jgi:hypothetical protein
MKRDANDVEDLKGETALRLSLAEKELEENSGWLSVDKLTTDYPDLRQYVINGWVREGEIINLVAPPKSGKSILASTIAYYIAAGKPLFGINEYRTMSGNVAIIDTELHHETLSHRMKMVHKSLELLPDINNRIFVLPMRRKLSSIFGLKEKITLLKSKKIKLLIIDCLYKLLPEGTDENSNADMTQVFNSLEEFFDILPGCAIMLIHHTSKGMQGGKSVADKGSGAGVFSRATDSHITLSEHEHPDHFVIEGIVRSFKRLDPFVLKYDYPAYTLAPNLNPEDIKGVKKKDVKNEKLDLANEEFASVLTTDWRSKKQVVADIKEFFGTSHKGAELLIDNVISRNGIESLSSIDGEKDCEWFICCNIKGLKFKKKVEEYEN